MSKTKKQRLGLSKDFLKLSDSGKNSWWRYLLGIILILVLGELIGYAPLDILYGVVDQGLIHGAKIADSGALQGIDPSIEFALTIFASVVTIGALYFIVPVLHKRAFKTIITTFKRARWSRIWYGFALWALLSFALSFILSAIFPVGPVEDLGHINPLSYGTFLVIAVVLTPIQTSSEELLFRGYLLQMFYRIGRTLWLPILSTSLLFAFVHFMSVGDSVIQWPVFLGYFTIGLLAALVTLKDGGIELALGLHAANNIILVPTLYADPSAPSVVANQPFGDEFVFLITTVAGALLFWVLTFRYRFSVERAS